MTMKSIILAVIVAVSCIQKSHAIPDDTLPAYTTMSGVVSGGAVTSMMIAADVDPQKSVIVGLLTGILCSILTYFNLNGKTVTARCQQADELLQQLDSDSVLAEVPQNDCTAHYSPELVAALEQKVNDASYLLQKALEDLPPYEVSQHIKYGLQQLAVYKPKIKHMQAHTAYEQVAQATEQIIRDPLVQEHVTTLSREDDSKEYVQHVRRVQIGKKKRYPFRDAFHALQQYQEQLNHHERLLNNALPKVFKFSSLATMIQKQQCVVWNLQALIADRMCDIESSAVYAKEQDDYKREQYEREKLAIEKAKAEAEASKARAEHERNAIELSKAQSERDKVAIELAKLRLQEEELRLKKNAFL